MKPLSAIKKDLEFNQALSSLLDVLKNIASAQFRSLEAKIRTYEKTLLIIESFFDFIDLKELRHPFLAPKNQQQAVVAITSDTGLLGGLNMQVVSTALAELEKIPGKLIVIGERGKMYAREFEVPFVAFSGINDEERYAQAMQLRDYCLDNAFKGLFGYLKVVYPRPVSFTVQTIETASFLPFSFKLPKKEEAARALSEVILESDIGLIIEYLVYLWMGQKFYEIFGLSRLAEFAARFVHLEGCLERIKEMDKKTRLEYFRVRHELIDRNMRELFAAKLAFR